jgi:hypothetical protein
MVFRPFSHHGESLDGSEKLHAAEVLQYFERGLEVTAATGAPCWPSASFAGT